MTTKKTNIFAEPVEEETDTEIVVSKPSSDSNIRRARIKGTWLMHWSNQKFDFEDGKTYHIPSDLYEYLKSNGNIYDTL